MLSLSRSFLNEVLALIENFEVPEVDVTRILTLNGLFELSCNFMQNVPEVIYLDARGLSHNTKYKYKYAKKLEKVGNDLLSSEKAMQQSIQIVDHQPGRSDFLKTYQLITGKKISGSTCRIFFGNLLRICKTTKAGDYSLRRNRIKLKLRYN